MTLSNDEKREKNLNFNENGKFIKGNIIARGKRKRTTITQKLMNALKIEGKKRGQDFWAAVAEKSYIDKDIMKAVVGKLIPNTSEITGLGGEPININLIKTIYSESINESNEP